MKKFIVITGGVISGIGKGITASSIANLFSKSYNILMIKFDGYLNVDPGTMRPTEHGEVFVLEDGGECDMDFGHYERFTNNFCVKEQSFTMGKIFQKVIKKEREGKYLGKNVQLIPDVTNLVQKEILNLAKKQKADIIFIEVGGTIGDLENNLIVESLRQMRTKENSKNMIFCHLSYLLKPKSVGEYKTKPTQQSINLLNQKGIFPDFLFMRGEGNPPQNIIKKLSVFSNLKEENIIFNEDVGNIYLIPLLFEKQNLTKKLCKRLDLKKPDLAHLKNLEKKILKKKKREINILISGKYNELEDSYFSILESLKHCEIEFSIKINLFYLNKKFDWKNIDGVVIPGGFGIKGIDKIKDTIKICRKKKIPILGICLGLQLMIIEFLENVCKLKNVNSQEINKKAKNLAIVLMDEQNNITELGGTMRLGKYESYLKNSKIKKLYEKLKEYRIENKKFIVSERHRHRFEVNQEYEKILEKHGLKIVGKSLKRNLVEFIELDKKIHPYFVGTQAHPELKSKPLKPSPLFYGLIENILKRKQ